MRPRRTDGVNHQEKSMKKIIALTSLLSFFAFAAEAQLESLQPKVSFSAWRILSDGGALLMEGPYHYAPGKHRSEISAEGQRITAIVREDREVLWTLIPGQNMYMEVSFDARELGNGSLFEGSEVLESRELGTEQLNGQRTMKHDVTLREPSGETVTGTLWMTDDMIPVKMDMLVGRNDRVIMELRDIQVGPQPDALFEIPAGYTKLSFPLGNIGNALRGASGNADERGDSAHGPSENDQPGFAEELASGAADAAREGARQGVRENVGRRVRGIFNRN
jgi:hypothetical protein